MSVPRKRCAIKSCRLREDKENEVIHYFAVPKSSLDLYQKTVSTTLLSQSSLLCSRHFDDDDIVKGKTIQDKFYPNKIWKLKTGAILKNLLSGMNFSSKFPIGVLLFVFFPVGEIPNPRKRRQVLRELNSNTYKKGIIYMRIP
jgi:hypothetical protein